jgi:hypothetical protein
MAGYSGTPLPKKLGIKPGAKLLLLGAPRGFRQTLGPLPEGVKSSTTERGAGPYDVVVAFFDTEAELRRQLPKLEHSIVPNGGLWIAYPKRASGVATDVTEDIVRKHALPRGLVDNKVCAIDEVWTGLRLVIRLERRPKP